MNAPPPAAARIDAALAKLLDGGVIASPDDASLFARDGEIRSNQGAPNPWVVSFFEPGGVTALAFVRPAPAFRDALREAARPGVPSLDGFPVLRAGSVAALERALRDPGGCLLRGTGPDGDEVSVAVASPHSLEDAVDALLGILGKLSRTPPSPPGV